MSGFALHPRLIRATVTVGDLALCRVLLIDAKDYPWLLLVPRRGAIEKIYQLSPADRTLLTEEVAIASNVLCALFDPFRINVADIGNLCEQLHIHVVGRQKDGPAWPAVVWGRPCDPWPDDTRRQARRTLFFEEFRKNGVITAP